MLLYQNSSFGLMSGSAPSLWSQFMNTVVPSQSGGKKSRSKKSGSKKSRSKKSRSKKSRSKKSRSKKSRSKKSKGGAWGAVAVQASVPAILLAAQQTFGNNHTHTDAKRRHNNKSRKNKSRRVRF